MTKKRFIGSSGGVYDKYKGNRFTWAEWEEIIQMMNNLNEKARERSKALSKLQKENEELKKQREKLFYRERDIKNEWRTLRKENEQLKKWKTLATIDNKIKIDEKRLKQEWGHYEMTEKRCTDCKHTKGIGYDFWCGEGHTEYEVFGAETNCPYFEYHDWSKGTPSETEKPFRVGKHIFDGYCIFDNNSEGYYAYEKQDLKKLCEILNDLYEKNKELEKENKRLRDCLTEIYTISKNESVE